MLLVVNFLFQSCTHYGVSPELSKQTRVPLSNRDLTCHQVSDVLLSRDAQVWTKFFRNYDEIKEFASHFSGIRISEEEVETLIRSIANFPGADEEIEFLRRAVLYSRLLKDKAKYEEFWSALGSYQEKHTKKPKVLRDFLREEKYLARYENKLNRRYQDQAPVHGKEVIKRKIKIYERNYYQCLKGATDPSLLSKRVLQQSNRVAIAVTVGGMGSALVTYAATNYDLPKDKKWWFEIFFVIVTSMAMSYVNAKFILANPKLKPWSQRLPLVLGASAVEDIGVTALYKYLIGEPDEDLKKKLLALESDAEFKETLTKALEFIQRDSLYQKYEKASRDFLQHVSPTGEVTKLSDVNLGEVKWEEVDAELTQELFLEALTEYEYAGNKGPLSLGDEAYDRYAFHRLIDLIYQPSFLIAAMIMHKQLCRATNPKVGMLTAITTFMAINMATDALYFFSRRGLINQ